MYEAPASQTSPPVKREITGPIEEDDDEDQSSSDDDDDDSKKQQPDDEGFVVVDESSQQSPAELKKAKRKLKLERAAKRAAEELERQQEAIRAAAIEEQKREKVLTFRDMSHLSYFGGGPTKIQKNNLIVQSSEDIAKDILNDIVTLLLDNLLPEDNQDTILKNTRNEVASDFVIDNNFESLRKKVFVKERMQPIARPAGAIVPIGQKAVKNTTFKNTKFVNNRAPQAEVISSEPVESKP